MNVRFVYTGNDGIAVQVDQTRGRANPGLDVRLCAHGDDAVAANCHGVRQVAVAIHRDNYGVNQYPISRVEIGPWFASRARG